MVAFTAKAVVLFLVVLIGLQKVFDAVHNLANFSTTTKHDKSTIQSSSIVPDESFKNQTLRGKNNINSLTVHDDGSQSSDSHHTPEPHREDISSQESSSEEENNDSEDRENTVSRSDSVSSIENAEPQSHQSTWERMWRHQIPADPTENPAADDDDVSMEEKEQLWQRLSNKTTASQKPLRDLFTAFSRPSRQHSIALYREGAYNELISDLVQSHQNGHNFTIVASGGSTTCGAAKNQTVTRQEERYYSLFAGYLNTLLSDIENNEATGQTVQWVGQGHGARTSLHTTIFFDSFIPQDTDLLLWEFSINDAIDWFGDPELFRKNLRNNLLVWLEEVGRMKRPAKVLLVYYWNTPYHHDAATNKIVGQAFEVHATIARQFDFVVGHVNMGSFIDEVDFPGCNVWETCPLLADKHHASKLGHIVTAYLLLNLMNPSKEFLLPDATHEDDNHETSYEWNCGLETDAKLTLKQAVTDPEMGWKPSIGGWTLDLPAYDQTTPRSLVAGPGLGEIELVDKADPLRQDRKRCTALKYCGEDIPFSVVASFEPMENVHAVLLVFKKHETVLYTEDINVFLNGSIMTTNGQLVPMRTEKDPSILRNWPCHFSGGWSAFADTYWYIFEDSQALVNSMELCIPSNVRNPPKIQSVAFW